jgi:hypothetical protein
MSGQKFGGWRMRANALAWIAGLAVLVGVAGCSSLAGGLSKDTPPEVKQAAVKERVNARWAALVKGDLEGAYEFLSPASRATVSLTAFKARKGLLVWKAARIESITCEAEACRVDLTATYDYPAQGRMMQGIQTALSETWVLDKGLAWLVFL